ncbi:MAG TPA: tRNA (cytidine(34)-2'-O)-methyltransferase [Polyangiales bacterium]
MADCALARVQTRSCLLYRRARMPITPKLRCPPLAPPFRVVLVEPEIPPNTGSIARTCAATSSPLHLIEPLGFRIDDRSLKRAGIDYWHLVDVHIHRDLPSFAEAFPTCMHFMSSEASRSYLEADLQPGDALVFGKESVGLPRELLQANRDRVWAIPTSGRVRSLNLSNAVAIVLFEALRRHCGLDATFVESDG